VDIRHSTVETQAPEEERLAAASMRFLTGGLTEEGDSFLIAVGAVLLTAALYALIGAWAFVAFPAVFFAAVIGRAKLRARR
jgi:hypothetical protein